MPTRSLPAFFDTETSKVFDKTVIRIADRAARSSGAASAFGGAPEMYYHGSQVGTEYGTTNIKSHSATATSKTEDVCNARIANILDIIQSYSSSMGSSFSQSIIETISEVAMSVSDGPDISLSDQLIEALSKIDPSLDDQGQLSPLTILCGPQVQKSIEEALSDPDTQRILSEKMVERFQKAREIETQRLMRFAGVRATLGENK